MIPKRVIQEYLNRQLESFRWLKKLPREELLQVLEEIDPPPWMCIDLQSLWNNQLVMLVLGIYWNEFLFFVDMGGGKTRVSIELISYRKACGENNCWLICVLNKVNVETWRRELKQFGPDLKYIVIDENNLDLLKEDADLFIIHYPGLTALCADYKKVKKGKKKGKKKRALNRKKLRVMRKKFTGVIFDEIAEVGSPKSTRSRICSSIAKDMEYRYGLTGTPFGRDPLPMWNQFKIIDRGETLGPTQGLFRTVFYRSERKIWGGREYSFKRNMKKDLYRMIQNRSITYTEGECQDLPERVPIKRIINLPGYMEAYYRKELSNLRRSKGNFVEIKASFIRMRQLASGFLGLKDDLTGARAEIEFPENPKLEDLLHVMKEIPVDAKMIIFHEFIWTGNRISKEFKALKIPHERLHGAQKDPGTALRRFQEDPECKYILINNYSGSMGLNLQAAHYNYYFESPYRPKFRIQGERRTRRSGQQSDRVFVIDAVAVDSRGHSIDQTVLDWLEDGKSLLTAVLTGKVRL